MFPFFPYTNFHRLNADWILKQIEDFKTALSAAVKVTVQTFTEAQKAQARANIGAVSASDIPSISGMVKYNEAQVLTAQEQSTARNNIGAGSKEQVTYNADNITQLVSDTNALQNRLNALEAEIPETYVSAQNTQAFTEQEKARARQNIGAISSADIPAAEGAVRYDVAQSLTANDQARARQNIGAISAAQEVLTITVHYPYSIPGTITDLTGPNAQDIHAALATNRPIIMHIVLEGNGQGVIDGDIFVPATVTRVLTLPQTSEASINLSGTLLSATAGLIASYIYSDVSREWGLTITEI